MDRLTGRKGLFATVLASLLLTISTVGAESDDFDLSPYRGKVVVLDFWASWCVPCRRSFPWMNEMHRKYGDDGLVVIAVNLDNQMSAADEFLRRYPAEFSIAYDQHRELARRFSVEAMPSTFLIDRQGDVVERHLGFKTSMAGEYEAAIAAALNSK